MLSRATVIDHCYKDLDEDIPHPGPLPSEKGEGKEVVRNQNRGCSSSSPRKAGNTCALGERWMDGDLRGPQVS